MKKFEVCNIFERKHSSRASCCKYATVRGQLAHGFLHWASRGIFPWSAVLIIPWWMLCTRRQHEGIVLAWPLPQASSCREGAAPVPACCLVMVTQGKLHWNSKHS